ncbi:APC family permease [Streptomyces silvisoli]|uniref:APC family permease n=1 Tax=Streptomyces silvisoli TaxID=3034235 RepID=A0ABT5ZLH2_9ACTN|nr:APC family permease [Streptomyces silvisoli]MDF3289838.1 APC family permease [Streptomyces silvisoli]
MVTDRQDGGEAGLRRDAVGVREVLFQSITAMAPGAAVVASIPGGAAFAGGSLPLSVLVALIGCLLTASCVGELARHLPDAGSVATYSAQGLHSAVGFLVAWAYVFVEALVAPMLLLQLGFTMAGSLHGQWAGYPAQLWWPWALAGAAVITVAGVYGIRAAARLGTALGLFEIAVFLLLAVLLTVRAGAHNTWSVFTTAHTAPGFSGAGGVLAGSVYCILAFAGFESAAPLAEEAHRPRHTVRLAVLFAALGVGGIYVFTTYAMAVFYGPDRFASFGAEGAASWDGVARASFGLMWVLVFLAVVNSCVGNANAGVTTATRTAFAFGRVGVLPRALAVVHPRHRSPVVAVGAQCAVALAVALGLGFGYGPTTAFYLVATIIVTVVIGVYIVVNLACAGFFLRRRRAQLRLVPHLLFPVLGIAAFVPALLTAAGLPVFRFVAKLAAPVSYAGAVVGVWMLLGTGVLLVLRRRHPQRLALVGRVHAQDEEQRTPHRSGAAPE